MEKNITTTLAYWLTETTFSKKNYYSDYITNPKKRIQTGDANIVGEDWWKSYVDAYKEVRDNGNLILRAKIITNNAVILYQVYKTKKDRDKFLHKINKPAFHNTVELHINEIEYSINNKKFIELIDKIISSDKKIIQHIVKEYQKPGMVIGDPLKDKILIRL
jgi:hypothetical protein|tara:strand:- start:76 stop:561 length:486 start_codon:yes stop_codon:yes gene_type:complete